jgi:hypothetical protein
MLKEVEINFILSVRLSLLLSNFNRDLFEIRDCRWFQKIRRCYLQAVILISQVSAFHGLRDVQSVLDRSLTLSLTFFLNLFLKSAIF